MWSQATGSRSHAVCGVVADNQAAKRGRHASKVSRDDMQRAIEKLGILGGGFKIVPVGARVMVVSVPYELNTDHATVLAQAESRGWVACGACAWVSALRSFDCRGCAGLSPSRNCSAQTTGPAAALIGC